MFDILWRVIQEYEITNKIGYFILDNSTTNDKTIRCQQNELKSLENSVLSNTSISFRFQKRRLHCFGHVVNLIVKVLLFRTGVNKEVGIYSEDEEEAIRREKKEIHW